MKKLIHLLLLSIMIYFLFFKDVKEGLEEKKCNEISDEQECNKKKICYMNKFKKCLNINEQKNKCNRITDVNICSIEPDCGNLFKAHERKNSKCVLDYYDSNKNNHMPYFSQDKFKYNKKDYIDMGKNVYSYSTPDLGKFTSNDTSLFDPWIKTKFNRNNGAKFTIDLTPNLIISPTKNKKLLNKVNVKYYLKDEIEKQFPLYEQDGKQHFTTVLRKMYKKLSTGYKYGNSHHHYDPNTYILTIYGVPKNLLFDLPDENENDSKPITDQNCLQKAVYQFGNKVTKSRQQLVKGSWSQVPKGCSVQSKGDWAAHFNTNTNPKNSRQVGDSDVYDDLVYGAQYTKVNNKGRMDKGGPALYALEFYVKKGEKLDCEKANPPEYCKYKRLVSGCKSGSVISTVEDENEALVNCSKDKYCYGVHKINDKWNLIDLSKKPENSKQFFIGNSGTNEKVVDFGNVNLHEYDIPEELVPGDNPQSPGWGDVFKLKIINNNKLSATRKDNGTGWGQQLYFNLNKKHSNLCFEKLNYKEIKRAIKKKNPLCQKRSGTYCPGCKTKECCDSYFVPNSSGTPYNCVWNPGPAGNGTCSTDTTPCNKNNMDETCKDNSENCAYWADPNTNNGDECEINPAYMLVNCRKSCKQC